jgi:shikimate kinase
VTAQGACRVILVGMMGSGKSTIGRLLSEATGWPYVDNDELVLRSHGATPRKLLAERGEAVMRAAESSALALGLEVPEPAIIGVAGGTILDPANRDRLRNGGIVVWLRADADALAARASGAEHRPWIDTGGGSWMHDATIEREPLYESVADITIDTTAGSPQAAAADLRGRLLALEACP